MTTAYRVPDNDCLCVAPGTTAAATRQLSTIPVRSFITSVLRNGVLPAGKPVVLGGIACDSGAGIRSVEVSRDGGTTWRAATLGKDLGRFSFREWTLPVTFERKGKSVLMVRAANVKGEVQPMIATWNPGGYRRHAVEATPVTVV